MSALEFDLDEDRRRYEARRRLVRVYATRAFEWFCVTVIAAEFAYLLYGLLFL
jgi:hypothetical protein